MNNKRLFEEIEGIVNPLGFTLGPLDVEPGETLEVSPYTARGVTLSYDIQRIVWHVCGQKVALRTQGTYLVEGGTLFIDPREVTSSWYDENLDLIISCPRCGRTLFTSEVRLFPLM